MDIDDGDSSTDEEDAINESVPNFKVLERFIGDDLKVLDGRWEGKLIASANAEIEAVNARIEKDTRIKQKDKTNLSDIFKMYSEAITGLLAEHFLHRYQQLTGETLTQDLVFRILVTILLIGSYNTSVSAYYADSKFFYHSDSFATNKQVSAFLKLIDEKPKGSKTSEKVSTTSDSTYQSGSDALWDRPFEMPAWISKWMGELNTIFPKFLTEGGHFSSNALLRICVDDLQFAGSGHQWSNAPISRAMNDKKAHSYGGHMDVAGSFFIRLPLCIGMYTKDMKRNGITRTEYFKAVLEKLGTEIKGIDTNILNEWIELYFDRGYGPEATAAIIMNYRVIQTVKKPFQRNPNHAFFIGAALPTWAEKLGHFKLVTEEGPTIASWAKISRGERISYQMCYRVGKKKAVMMEATTPDWVDRWVAVPVDSDGYKKNLSSRSEESMQDEWTRGLDDAMKHCTERFLGKVSSTAAVQGGASSITLAASTRVTTSAPVASTTTPIHTSHSVPTISTRTPQTRSRGPVIPPELEAMTISIHKLEDWKNQVTFLTFRQGTGIWRLLRSLRVSSTGVLHLVGHVCHVAYASLFMTRRRTLLEVASSPFIAEETSNVNSSEPSITGPEVSAVSSSSVTPTYDRHRFWRIILLASGGRFEAERELLPLLKESQTPREVEVAAKKLKVSIPAAKVGNWLTKLLAECKAKVVEGATKVCDAAVPKFVKCFFGSFPPTLAMQEGSIVERFMREKFSDQARNLGSHACDIDGNRLEENPLQFCSKVFDLPLIARNNSDVVAASLDGIFCAGPSLDNILPHAFEAKLLQEKAAKEQREFASSYGKCIVIELGIDSLPGDDDELKSALEEITKRFQIRSHFFQVLHHCAVANVTRAVYVIGDAKKKDFIRVVILHVDVCLIDAYYKEISATASRFMQSDDFASGFNSDELSAFTKLRSAIADAQINFRDAGVKPEIALVWNKCKNPSDMMGKQVDDIRILTSGMGPVGAIALMLIYVHFVGICRVFAAANAKLEKDTTLDQKYRALQDVGSIRALARKMAADLEQEVKSSPTGVASKPLEHLRFVQLGDEEWRELQLEEIGASRKGKGVLALFREEAKFKEIRRTHHLLFQHTPVSGKKKPCDYCCIDCTADTRAKKSHKRIGRKTVTSCSCCGVNLCLKTSDLGASCWERFHNDKVVANHPFLVVKEQQANDTLITVRSSLKSAKTPAISKSTGDGKTNKSVSAPATQLPKSRTSVKKLDASESDESSVDEVKSSKTGSKRQKRATFPLELTMRNINDELSK